MNILVIGGSGFIGTRLVSVLSEAGHYVRIFDKNPSLTWPGLVTIGDVRDLPALEKNLAGIDIVYNLAAEHRDDVSPVSLYYDVNVRGAENVSAAALKNDVKKIIFTSTVAVYGLDQVNPCEKSKLAPFNHYGKSKLQAEKAFTCWASECQEHSLAIIRPVVIFGEGNRGNVYNLIKQVQSRKFMMVGSGQNRKSMAYVGNVANFLAKIADLDCGISIFNYSDKPDLTVSELVKFIKREIGENGEISRLPYAVGLLGAYCFDFLSTITRKKYAISSVRVRKFCANTSVSANEIKKIDFRPPFTIEEGLKKMIKNLEENIYFEGGG